MKGIPLTASEWADHINGSENAPSAARPNGAKGIVELECGREWAAALASYSSIYVTSIHAGPKDPPDLYGVCEDRLITIELAQLVRDRDLVPKRAQLGRDEVPPFGDRLWKRNTFRAALNEVLDRKETKYVASKQAFDVLVVHHDHDWLRPEDVAEWLYASPTLARSSFGSAYLILRLQPYEAVRPLFRLFG